LVQTTLSVGKTEILKPLSRRECQDNRDSLAKGMYERLFSWLVDKLNERLQVERPAQAVVLGLLDIYGF
jgi:myosin heavy subunit